MVSPVSSYNCFVDPASAGSIGNNTLGQDDFLQLVIAQLQNQNPLEPQKDTEFIAQLAQFDALNQMRALNQAMSVMRGLAELSQASALIGKDIEAITDAGERITGRVDSVSMVNGLPMLDVGGRSIDLYNVIKVTAPEAAP
jgi:flagellar basal-body rod modification protein FlgD